MLVPDEHLARRDLFRTATADEAGEFRFASVPPARDSVKVSALTHVVDTFFEGSAQKVVAALLGRDRARISQDDLDKIADMVDKARKGGRR